MFHLTNVAYKNGILNSNNVKNVHCQFDTRVTFCFPENRHCAHKHKITIIRSLHSGTIYEYVQATLIAFALEKKSQSHSFAVQNEALKCTRLKEMHFSAQKSTLAY